MIKYAHRGLVKNGKLPSLFYQLYLLINVVFYSLWLLLAFFSFLYSHSNSLEKSVLKTFKGNGNIRKETSVHRYWQYFAASLFIFLIILLIMSLGIFYSKRYLRKNHCYFRQNVFTLNSTMFWGLIHIGLFISSYITVLQINLNIVHLSVLRFFMIFSHFIKSFVTIFENQKYLPELFSDMDRSSRSFYFGLTIICPRPETLTPFIPFRQNAR